MLGVSCIRQAALGLPRRYLALRVYRLAKPRMMMMSIFSLGLALATQRQTPIAVMVSVPATILSKDLGWMTTREGMARILLGPLPF